MNDLQAFLLALPCLLALAIGINCGIQLRKRNWQMPTASLVALAIVTTFAFATICLKSLFVTMPLVYLIVFFWALSHSSGGGFFLRKAQS